MSFGVRAGDLTRVLVDGGSQGLGVSRLVQYLYRVGPDDIGRRSRRMCAKGFDPRRLEQGLANSGVKHPSIFARLVNLSLDDIIHRLSERLWVRPDPLSGFYDHLGQGPGRRCLVIVHDLPPRPRLACD